MSLMKSHGKSATRERDDGGVIRDIGSSSSGKVRYAVQARLSSRCRWALLQDPRGGALARIAEVQQFGGRPIEHAHEGSAARPAVDAMTECRRRWRVAVLLEGSRHGMGTCPARRMVSGGWYDMALCGRCRRAVELRLTLASLTDRRRGGK
jgi:hypothetical protein